jgi:hypothetical protein
MILLPSQEEIAQEMPRSDNGPIKVVSPHDLIGRVRSTIVPNTAANDAALPRQLQKAQRRHSDQAAEGHGPEPASLASQPRFPLQPLPLVVKSYYGD